MFSLVDNPTVCTSTLPGCTTRFNASMRSRTHPHDDRLRHGRHELVIIDHAVGHVAVVVLLRVGVALTILRERSRHATQLHVKSTRHLRAQHVHVTSRGVKRTCSCEKSVIWNYLRVCCVTNESTASCCDVTQANSTTPLMMLYVGRCYYITDGTIGFSMTIA